MAPFYNDPFFRQFFGDRTYTQQVQGLGSGFIISADGYIITNQHVVNGADSVTVSLPDGVEFEAAIVGEDPTTDIAVLRIEPQGLTALRLGDGGQAGAMARARAPGSKSAVRAFCS
mgnify:CR=1 FL=1